MRWWRSQPMVRRRAKISVAANSIWKKVEPAWPALLLLLVLVVPLLLLRSSYQGLGDITRGIYIEAWGTVLDILLVSIVLTYFAVYRDRRERILRYLEEIDDLKKWDSEQARLHIAGNIRRLARLGKTDIDLSGVILRNFSFVGNDIDSLKGATFSLGLRFDRLSKNSTQLEEVDFNHVDCTNVTFSSNSLDFAGFGLIGKNLSFVGAKLTGSSFKGAKLTWTNFKPSRDDWYVDHGLDEDDQPTIEQIHYPPFDGVDLEGCSFRNAVLDHADFRNADNVLKADFGNAKGLETCFFDEGIAEKVIELARKTRSSIALLSGK